jgi:hypothetical protein
MEDEGRPVHKADNLTAICEPIVYKMCENMFLNTGNEVGEILGEQGKESFLKPERSTGLFCKMKKKSNQCITFLMNVEDEGLDFVLYMWEISG